MGSDFDIEQARHKISFLYRHTAMSSGYLSCWLECDEFVKRVWDVVSSRGKVDDRTLLEITRSIYDERIADKAAFPEFKFRGARRGIHQLEKACSESQ